MTDEPNISEDYETYDDERELRRLTRSVRFARKHYLYFVCCNQVPKQNQLIADVKKAVKDKPIKVVRFKKPITDLLTELQKQELGADCAAVFVQGLEYSIASDAQGAENALIHNLNISRDSFKKYLACPLFLWLPEYALVKITRHAPDFFSVRSGTFYFSNPPEIITGQIFQSVSSSSNWTKSSSLPIAEKLAQIERLESLLEEYHGLHKEKQDKSAEERLLTELANFYDSISEYRKAIDFYKRALAISREIGDRFGEAVSLGNLGNAHRSLGEYRKAIEYHEQSLAISREIGDRSGEGISLGNMGTAYNRLGEFQKALDFHEQSLAISHQIGDSFGKGNSLSNLGITYKRLGEYQKAIDFYKRSLAISREIGDRFGEAVSLGNLGTAYGRLGEYRKAIEYHEQYLAISREIGNRLGEGISLGNMGTAYDRLGERGNACKLWKNAMVILESIESPNANFFRRLIEENCQK